MKWLLINGVYIEASHIYFELMLPLKENLTSNHFSVQSNITRKIGQLREVCHEKTTVLWRYLEPFL